MTFTRDWTANPRELWPAFLGEMAGKPNLRFLEIGTFEGRTAVFLLDTVLTHPSSSITVVDTFEGSPEFENLEVEEDFGERFFDNIAPYREKVYVLIGPSALMIPELAGEFDFAYIDGSHYADDVWADATGVWPLLRAGAVLAFDDYDWGSHGDDSPRPAINRFLEQYADELEVLHHGYQVIVRKK